MLTDKLKANIISVIVLLLGIYFVIFGIVNIACFGETLSRGDYIAVCLTLADGVVLTVGDIVYNLYRLTARKKDNSKDNIK